MLVQPTQDEGASSERLSDEQPSPSPAPLLNLHSTPSPNSWFHDSIPEPTGENLGDHSSNEHPFHGMEDDRLSKMSMIFLYLLYVQQVPDHAKEFKLLKAKITKPRSKLNLEKKAKGESEVQRDPLFDVMPEDKIDHMEIENAQSEGRTRELVDEDKKFDEDRLSTEDVVSTDKEGVSTEEHNESTEDKVSTDEQTEGTEESNESTEEIFESSVGQREGTEDQTKEEIASKASQTSTQTPTSMTFGDDETIATLLLNMSKAKAASKEKEKGVELKDVEEIDRPRPTSTRSLLTLKPLQRIIQKTKGRRRLKDDAIEMKMMIFLKL
ncbi:hypothetical protein Tco_1167111 [Tanacetum coccineum]